MKALLVGSGAREHCIAEALTKSKKVSLSVFATTLNPGIEKLAAGYKVTTSLLDFNALAEYVKEFDPMFAFIGPEDPLCAGIADFLMGLGVSVVGPLKAAAQLEGSKSFTRNLLEKYGISGNPKYRVFTDLNGMREFIVNDLGENYVVKAEGLMGGKGVMVSGDHLQNVEEGITFAKEAIEKFGRVVVEEKLIGQEFSLFFLVDGETVLNMIPAQDHKRAFDGDKGPNTGGMGSYTDVNHSLPFLHDEDLKQAHDISSRVVKAVKSETGIPFKGVLYGGFMAVRDGVRLIEYNVRFGDPEVMNVLPLLKTDFVDVCLAIINGSLDKINLEFEPYASVCKYVVPNGYPTDSVKNEKIIMPDSVPSDAKLYIGSVDKREDGLYLAGSRAFGCVGFAETIDAAELIAEELANQITGPVFHRNDVGTNALIADRVEMMSKIRG